MGLRGVITIVFLNAEYLLTKSLVHCLVAHERVQKHVCVNLSVLVLKRREGARLPRDEASKYFVLCQNCVRALGTVYDQVGETGGSLHHTFDIPLLFYALDVFSFSPTHLHSRLGIGLDIGLRNANGGLGRDINRTYSRGDLGLCLNAPLFGFVKYLHINDRIELSAFLESRYKAVAVDLSKDL